MIGERRVVTVLFGDISGFTALSERLDPEEVCRLLNACFDALVPVVEKYGGAVDKFIGDEVMALFGAPVAHEDDPARALRAALEMLDVLSEFNARHGTGLGLHVGINTGLVVAGGIGSQGKQRYTVMGDAVNLAARLRDISVESQILAGPDTYRLTAPLFEFDALAPVRVKGKAEAVQAYRVRGLKAQPGPVRGVTGLRSPMVGRATELATLRRLGAELRGGRGHIALVLGDAGLGKSRLIAEWHNAAGRAGTGRWATGRSLSYGQGLAYHLVEDLVRALAGAGTSGSASQGDTQVALLALTEALFGAEAGEVYPYLGQLLSLPLTGPAADRAHALGPETVQAHYLMALRRLLQAMAAREPLVLVLEDMHWADSSSTDLLATLLPLAAESPVLFCIAVRHETGTPGWELAAAARRLHAAGTGVTEVNLRPLAEAEARELVDNLLGPSALPEPLMALVLDKAEGNPFFVEEVLRMLIDQGAIVHGDGRWTARHVPRTVEIPDTLQGLLLARIDRLPAEAKQVLQMACVLGRRFALPVIERALGDGANVLRIVADLEAAGIVRVAQAQPELEVQFCHTSVQEAAYHALLKEARRELHRVAGETLEALYADRVEEVAHLLAQHFTEAGDDARALRYQTLAGDVNFRRYAVPEAVAHYGAALDAARRSGAAAGDVWRHLYTRLGRSLELDAQYQRALELYAELEAHARAQGDRTLELAAVMESARIRATPNPAADVQLAERLANRALALAEASGDRAAEARIRWILMLVCRLNGKPADARAQGERSLALAREQDLKEQLAYTLQDLHRAYWSLNLADQARAALDEGRELWRALGNLPMLADSLASSADLAATYGEVARARAFAEEAVRLSRSIGNLWNESFGNLMLGEIHAGCGEAGEALARLRVAEELGRRAGLHLVAVRARLDRATLYTQAGAYDAAREEFEHVNAAIEQAQQPYAANFRLESLMQRARLEIRAGRLDAAADLLARARQQQGNVSASVWHGTHAEYALAHDDPAAAQAAAAAGLAACPGPRHGARPYLLWLAGRAALDLGERQAAAEALQAGLSLARELQQRPLLPRLLDALAELAAQQGEAERAAEYQREARAVRDELRDHAKSAKLTQQPLYRPT